MLKIAVAALIGFGVACGLTYQLTHDQYGKTSIKGRGGAYIVCALAVFTFSVLWGIGVARPVHPGDEQETMDGRRVVIATEYVPGLSLAQRDRYIENTFMVLIIPALIGVRVGLGRKPQD